MMKEYIIEIKSKDKASEFCNICSKFNGDIDVSCGTYNADGKSLLGVYGLPRNTEITVRTNFTLDRDNDEFSNMLSSYIVR